MWFYRSGGASPASAPANSWSGRPSGNTLRTTVPQGRASCPIGFAWLAGDTRIPSEQRFCQGAHHTAHASPKPSIMIPTPYLPVAPNSASYFLHHLVKAPTPLVDLLVFTMSQLPLVLEFLSLKSACDAHPSLDICSVHLKIIMELVQVEWRVFLFLQGWWRHRVDVHGSHLRSPRLCALYQQAHPDATHQLCRGAQ